MTLTSRVMWKKFVLVVLLLTWFYCLPFLLIRHLMTSEPRLAKEPRVYFPNMTTPEAELLKRRERVEELCRLIDVKGAVHGVYTHSSGVLYCFVPKAGCTFWKRIFVAITKLNYTKQHEIFSVSRTIAHSALSDPLVFNYVHNLNLYPVRLIVTRDPFSRLLSAYIDKFYLPNFWRTEVKGMVFPKNKVDFKTEDDYLRRHMDEIIATFGGNATGLSSRHHLCAKYVTFAEFAYLGLNRHEPHWMPITQICDPCQFQVTHVGLMHTFTEDARVVLNHMGLIDILDDMNAEKQVDDELQMTVDYSFRETFSEADVDFYPPCITTRELAFRLWHSFQWRGYIDPDVKFVIPDFSDKHMVASDLLIQVWRARESGLKNPAKMKKAKKNFLVQAYSSVRKSLFHDLCKKHHLDFTFFGYENVRDKLFYSLYNEDYKEYVNKMNYS